MTTELARSNAPSRRMAGALAVVLTLAAVLAPVGARAQSKSDAFAGKIPPVSAALFRKAGRFEATLSGNLSINDAFYSKYFGGLKLGYHFTESWSGHLLAAGGLNTKAGSAQVCPSNGGCHSANRAQMFQVPGKIKLMTGAEAAWAPIYGKLNAFSGVAHFDLGREDKGIAANRWLTEIFEPIMAMVPPEARGKLEPAEIFHEILVHRWYLSERAGHEIGIFDTARDYIDTVLRKKPDEKVAAEDAEEVSPDAGVL